MSTLPEEQAAAHEPGGGSEERVSHTLMLFQALGDIREGIGELRGGLLRVQERIGRLETRLEERVGGLEARMEERFGRMEERVGRVETRLQEQGGRLESRLEERVGRVDARLDEVRRELGGRIDALDTRLLGVVRWAVSTFIAVLAAAGGLAGLTAFRR